jgi:transcription initiation factor TFIIH subunit 3
MDDISQASHLSVVVDLSPMHWDLSAREAPENTYPLSLASFLSQLLAFLNTHIACRHENTLAVFGAFPGKRWVEFASHGCCFFAGVDEC